ncbi:uncharacterized protein LOC130777215 [Actinidia eriantha]|uniref:uncharacterized protein LOC130777215 n=1 Tax=Actinidia eriantha TaxID=165200 RepID=UPI00258337FB|nr:uncharacterized protein LOC130777215 [Actinidia eriantha]
MAIRVSLLAALFLSLLLISSSSNVLADYDQHNKYKGQIKKELVDRSAAQKLDFGQLANGSGNFGWHRKRLEAKLPADIKSTSPGHSPGFRGSFPPPPPDRSPRLFIRWYQVRTYECALFCSKHFAAIEAQKTLEKSTIDEEQPHGLFAFSSVIQFQTLMIRARRHRRIMFRQAVASHFMVVLICTLFHTAVCGPCSINGMRSLVEFDEGGSFRDNHRSFRDNHNSGFQDAYGDDVKSGHLTRSRFAHVSVESICSSSNLFCFPSTLPGLSDEHSHESTILEASAVQSDAALPVGLAQARNNISWSSNYGTFALLSGRAVSCSLNSQEGIHDFPFLQTSNGNQNYVSSCGGPLRYRESPGSNLNENSEMIKSGFLDGSQFPYIEISPPLLDWGQKYLYFPSFAFLTVANTHSDSILYLYEPFSTNTQFYPCNFSEVLLRPGEVASICFVFLPSWLGMSSAHLILQTSSGGFLISAKGFAVESPYRIRPLVGLDMSSSGRRRKNLSLFNPFDETLYVEEVTAWISVSLGNTSYLTEAICRVENHQGSGEHSMMNVQEWLDVRTVQTGSPLMAMRPHRNWDIGPGSTETIIEIDFSNNSVGKIVGAFCMQLLRPSKDKSDVIMVPLEAELVDESGNLPDSVSLSLGTLVPCDASDTAVVAISLRNGAPHVLNVVKISLIGEGARLFQIKYVEGLILFSGTITQVAVVSYVPLPIGLHGSPSEIPNIKLNCKLIILTNDSSSPQLEALCEDIVSICSKIDSSPKYKQQAGNAECANARTWSSGSSMQSPSHIEAMEAAEPDELVLGNWRAQGTARGMSVLDDHEVLFPMVQVGTYHSKWITVKNPSQLPVVMQLILNSGEIIDECRKPDGLLQPSSSIGLVLGAYATPIRHGFSIGESALTEAFVHPHGTASLGPILFHPSNRCGWRSSALIRNNLSGVEWLSLQGFGGSFSLVLSEGPNPLQNLEFKLKLPSRLNVSSPDIFYRMDETTLTCSQPLSKELYAKNTGDLPLEVRRIEVSGSECGLDGFLVHTCKGFVLEPGESTKLLVSYQPDFSAAMVQRDLELALGTGIRVIPMKAVLPLHILNLCKKSMFWMRVKKFSLVILAAFVMFLILFCIVPQLMALNSQDYFLKNGKSSIPTVKLVGKSSRAHRNQKNSSKFSVSSKTNGLSRSIGEEETLLPQPVNRCPDGQGGASEQGMAVQYVNPTVANQRQTNSLLNTQKDTGLESCAFPESCIVENSDLQEASKDGKLTVRIGKEKGRRRKKKRGSVTGLMGIFEVSSSQSGNSTPSSPLSPVTSFTPKRSWPVISDACPSVEVRNQSPHLSEQQWQKSSGTSPASKAKTLEPEVSMKYSNDNCVSLGQEKPYASVKVTGKPVLLPSTTFPCTSKPVVNLTCPSPCTASPSSIAPHARAPGSNLYNQKTVKTEVKTGIEDQFKYDIWGDHLSGLHFMSKAREVSSMTSSVTESHSDSFFVSGPQTLVTKSPPKSALGPAEWWWMQRTSGLLGLRSFDPFTGFESLGSHYC